MNKKRQGGHCIMPYAHGPHTNVPLRIPGVLTWGTNYRPDYERMADLFNEYYCQECEKEDVQSLLGHDSERDRYTCYCCGRVYKKYITPDVLTKFEEMN